MKRRVASGAYAGWSAVPRGPRPSVLKAQAEPHVVVVPYEGRDSGLWGPGHRNLYFEAGALLGELQGHDRVSFFHVDRGTASGTWHTQLVDYLNDVGATHVLTHIEGDPGAGDGTWTWDSAWSLMDRFWGGVLLGTMFDSAFRYTFLKGKFLARMSPRFLLVDICMPMDGALVRGVPEVGPVNMPMSDESMALVEERLSTVEVEHDVSFVGVLYPNRIEMIEALRAEGFSVVVNPHRQDEARTRQETMANQPGWLEYMAGLAGSRATINFSESSAGGVQQLKTRVIEAGLAGTLLLTDDVNLTSRFWTPDVEYGYFSSLGDLPGVAESFLSDGQRSERARVAFAHKSRELARTGFWGEIDSVLLRRGLPSVLA